MSELSTINLEQLPTPDVVETLSFETILEAMRNDLISRDASLEAALNLESEPMIKLLEVCAYREMLLRQRVNDASRAVMLSSARGADLDNLAILFGISRLELDPGKPEAQPPIPPTMENDENLRRRVQLSLEGHSTAGAQGSYVFWGLYADAKVKDIDVQSPTPGNVLVTILSTEDDGKPDQALLETVDKALNDKDVRPLTDRVTIQAAEIIRYEIEASLTLYDGPDSEVVRQAAEQAVQRYVHSHHLLGHDIILSGLYAALHQPGVQQVHLTKPDQNQILEPHQAAYCNRITVTTGTRDE